MHKNASATEHGREPASKGGELLIGGDLRVTRLGYGAMRITGIGIWGEPADRSEAIRVVRRAVELGINFIDTADSYGPHVSEEIIAEALYPYPKGVVIATKGGFERPGPDRWVENGRPEYLKSACEGSLRRLHLDRIDLYQLHSVAQDRAEGSGSGPTRRSEGAAGAGQDPRNVQRETPRGKRCRCARGN